MRKITRDAVQAFYAGTNYRNTNTEVKNGVYMLHGNIIAVRYDNGDIEISLAGWNTNTTRERLNGLEGVEVRTKQGQAYLNGEPWDGTRTKIN